MSPQSRENIKRPRETLLKLGLLLLVLLRLGLPLVLGLLLGLMLLLVLLPLPLVLLLGFALVLVEIVVVGLMLGLGGGVVASLVEDRGLVGKCYPLHQVRLPILGIREELVRQCTVASSCGGVGGGVGDREW